MSLQPRKAGSSLTARNPVNGVVANITTANDPAVNGGSKTLREKPSERGSGNAAFFV